MNDDYNSICRHLTCRFSSFFNFCKSKEAAHTTAADLIAFTFYNHVRTCKFDKMETALKCVCDGCDDCNFKKNVLKCLSDCPKLRDIGDGFMWMEWSQLAQSPSASELLAGGGKAYEQAVLVAHGAKIVSSGIVSRLKSLPPRRISTSDILTELV